MSTTAAKEIWNRYKSIVLFLLPVAIYVVHASFFINWIIDDAGISFAYARNLASGYGLVLQPGRTPVEGFSNLSWVLLLTPFFYFKIFDPQVVPKLLGFVLVVFCFYLLWKSILLISTDRKPVAFLVLFFLSINTSFVVWTTSGLENPLYIFLITSYFYSLLIFGIYENHSRLVGVLTGSLVALISITRPEGLIYALIFPVFTLSFANREDRSTKKMRLIQPAYFLLGFVICFGGFLLFRILYFGDILPNTFYAKGGPSLGLISTVTKTVDLLFGVSGWLFLPLFIWLIATTLYLIKSRELKSGQFTLLIFLIFSMLNYILLPQDWMGEYRFATPFVVFFYSYILVIGESLWKSIEANKPKLSIVLLIVMSICAVYSIKMFRNRTIRFSEDPTVSFFAVGRSLGDKFDDYAYQLGISNASVLLPDLGGTAYFSSLRIYDLAGLCDWTIARTLGKDQTRFYDYIFEEIKPTFIHVHSYWAYVAALDKDARFRLDYKPINEYIDPYVLDTYGQVVYSWTLANIKG